VNHIWVFYRVVSADVLLSTTGKIAIKTEVDPTEAMSNFVLAILATIKHLFCPDKYYTFSIIFNKELHVFSAFIICRNGIRARKEQLLLPDEQDPTLV